MRRRRSPVGGGALPETPEGTIRGYLAEHGRTVQVPAHNLLSTWQLSKFDRGSRRRIAKALSSVGIEVEPPLSNVDRDSVVTLTLLPEPEPSPSSVPPPWTPRDRGGGRPTTTADASQPRLAELGAPPEAAAVPGMNGPRRFRARLRRVPQSNDGVAARSRSCAVCERAGPESESDLLSSGWRVSEQLRLCPACQTEGWQLPERGPLPFRHHVSRP